MESQEVLSPDAEEHQSSDDMDRDTDRSYTTIRPVCKSVDWSVAVDNQQTDEDVMQYRVRVTGSWRDGLVTTLWIFWWTRVLP